MKLNTLQNKINNIYKKALLCIRFINVDAYFIEKK